MDSAKLSRKLHEQLDGLLDSIMSHDPDDGDRGPEVNIHGHK